MQSPLGFPSQGIAYPQAAVSPSLGQIALAPPGTYPSGAMPSGQAPPIQPTPGPTALGPGSVQGSLGTGVQGVGISPVSSVVPPSTAGGPHQLPPLPACPLPEGFPNPFEGQPPAQTPAASPSASPSPFSPGTVTYTGPRGHMPGLGYFGPPGQAGAPAPAQAAPPQQPVLPQQSAGANASPQPLQASPSSPFWMALAWQLLQTPAARDAMGDGLQRLMAGADRVRAIQAGAALLLTPEMQSAFKSVSNGQTQQAPFTHLFAARVQPALQRVGLLAG